jgi:hypothetical protein
MDTTTLAALQSANAFKSKNPSTVLVVNRTAIVNNSVVSGMSVLVMPYGKGLCFTQKDPFPKTCFGYFCVL